MSRTSRIPHPSGSRYVAIYAWAVGRFGLAGAAIIGLLDFLDRAQTRPSQPLASRARIIADLEGISGRDAIDQALKVLQDASVIERNTITTPGLRNIENRVLYSLNPTGLALIFETPEIRSSRNSGFQESPEPLKSGLKSGLPSYINLEEEAAAPRAHACGPADAAAISSTGEKRRHPRRTANGIECWYPLEDVSADTIENSALPEQITGAVAAIKARKNTAGKPQSPVPALVAEELERARRAVEAVELATAAAQRQALPPTLVIDPAAAAKGEQILAGIRRKSKNQIEVTTHD